jgi:predicted metal-binding membrane protein
VTRAMIGAASQRRAFVVAGLGLAATSWVLLAAWDASPWARYLDHGDWTQIGMLGSICAAVPYGEALLPVGLYVGGWVLMLTAMMLPTALPVLSILQRVTARRRRGGWYVALAAAGYLAAWTGFGLAAHGADLAVNAAVQRSVWLIFNGWALGAAVLLLAGLFQFSDLKRRCLERCHSPLAEVTSHWRGRHPAREAWALGLAHGTFCVGCCWALMLIMFVVGSGNLGWMLLLGLVMAAEKNLPWGRRLSAPVGVALIGWSAAIVALHAA